MESNEIYSTKAGKKCVIYIRVSSERQVQGYSLDGQKRYLTEWAEREGMTVSEVYIEPGKSGKSITGRERFMQMMEDIENGALDTDYVVVYKLSRFGRNAKDTLNSLTRLQQYGVNLICKEDNLDSSSAIGRMMITILSAVAEMERENINVQTMLGREEKAKQGGWNGGSAPYGYELDKKEGKLIIKEDEADIVRLIFDKFINSNLGYSGIAGYLNQQGIRKNPSKNSHGRKFVDWNSSQIQRILDNPVYTGKIAFGKTRTEKIKGIEHKCRRVKSEDYILSDKPSHEAIISEDVFEKAQIKRKETASTGNPSIGRTCKHLLSGILKCPMCGSSMYADKAMWTTKDGVRREHLNYQCGHYAKSKNGQCKKNPISAEWIEKEVIEYTRLLVRNKQFAEDIQKQIGKRVDVSEIDIEIANYKKHLEELKRSKNNLEKDIDNIFDDDKRAERKRNDMNKRLNKLYDEIYTIEDMITDCEQRKLSAEKDILTRDNVYKMLLLFDELFDKMSKEDKRRLIESLISEVHLHPKETWKAGNNPIKEIKYTFPVSDEVMEELRENASSAEVAVLLCRADT